MKEEIKNTKKKKRMVNNVGVNDSEEPVIQKGVRLKSYDTWREMIRRCYNPKLQSRCNTYIGCSVCDEWLFFSNFKLWFDKHYKKGCDLDKDILLKNNKVYSPATCCFVPHEINMLLAKRGAKRGKYPIGIGYSKNKCKFRAYLTKRGVFVHLGYYATIEDAFCAYREAKEMYLREIAEEYLENKQIPLSVYNALVSYSVEISD